MAALAGIIPLNGDDVAPERQLILMLDAMKPTIPSHPHVFVMPHHLALVGGLSYGPSLTFSIARANGAVPTHVLCAGELFNDDLAPSQSAADFLLERYQRLGPDHFAAGLNGSFSAVIVDPSTRSVLLVTDHMASSPIFLAQSNNRVYFASEVKAFLAVSE